MYGPNTSKHPSGNDLINRSSGSSATPREVHTLLSGDATTLPSARELISGNGPNSPLPSDKAINQPPPDEAPARDDHIASDDTAQGHPIVQSFVSNTDAPLPCPSDQSGTQQAGNNAYTQPSTNEVDLNQAHGVSDRIENQQNIDPSINEASTTLPSDTRSVPPLKETTALSTSYLISPMGTHFALRSPRIPNYVKGDQGAPPIAVNQCDPSTTYDRPYTIWDHYNVRATKVDADLIKDANDTAQLLLTFAGLLSAALAAFIAIAFAKLSPDPNETLLAVLTTLKNDSISMPNIQKSPSYGARVNAFLFGAISVAMVVAVLCIFVNQWARSYQERLQRTSPLHIIKLGSATSSIVA
ncbi:SubName: Full=Uncharacterized protein {ECO:0000313/EMBL:CCA73714.1} [Serendipita indica DSM 11827]|nr:SubName: Full=Uncharacterized protein {ECO:0000313/EMBL:CCA73714.1} [Serendipita indica DSM 11827]